jgi:hypothetical protein
MARDLWRRRYLPLSRAVDVDEAEPESPTVAGMPAHVAGVRSSRRPDEHHDLLARLQAVGVFNSGLLSRPLER